MTELRLSVRNTSDTGGTATTPFYFGFHNGGFDLFNVGEAASPGLERLAEDGIFAPNDPSGFTTLADERLAGQPDSQGTAVVGTTPAGGPGPIAAGTQHSRIIDIADPALNQYVSFGAMLLPSNDAFVGTDDAIQLFDAYGNFNGASTTVFSGGDVYDAGTEFNTEEDAAFLNQTGPNTGLDENGVVRLHEGFNGSEGNPDGSLGNPDGQPGAQNILGGTNAFGQTIDPEAADFTREGAQVATVHINTVVRRDGGDGRDFIFGGRDDDIVNAGDGRDFIFGRSGWDDLNGEGGNDKIFGGRGNDLIDGGSGNDWISGGRDDDIISGGTGRDDIRGGSGNDQIHGGDHKDWISGGSGNDIIAGGQGNDYLNGNRGDDTFVFVEGDGNDVISGFDRRGDDDIILSVDGFEDFDDVLAAATQERRGVDIDFGDGDSIFLRGTSLSSLDADDFSFV